MLFLGSETQMLSDILVDAACAWPQLAPTLILLLALLKHSSTCRHRFLEVTALLKGQSVGKIFSGKERERQKPKKTDGSEGASLIREKET
ncbi:hypothetical protein AOLI_G00007250 [Acnodon oligacanthus]